MIMANTMSMPSSIPNAYDRTSQLPKRSLLIGYFEKSTSSLVGAQRYICPYTPVTEVQNFCRVCIGVLFAILTWGLIFSKRYLDFGMIFLIEKMTEISSILVKGQMFNN